MIFIMKEIRNTGLLLHECIHIVFWKSKAIGQKADECFPGAAGEGAPTTVMRGELSALMEVSCIVSVVVITRLCTLAKTH